MLWGGQFGDFAGASGGLIGALKRSETEARAGDIRDSCG